MDIIKALKYFEALDDILSWCHNQCGIQGQHCSLILCQGILASQTPSGTYLKWMPWIALAYPMKKLSWQV